MTVSPVSLHKSPLANGQQLHAKQHDLGEPASSFKEERPVEKHNLCSSETVMEPAASAFCNAPAMDETATAPEVEADIEATPSIEEQELPEVRVQAPATVAPATIAIAEESPETLELLEVLEAYRKRVKQLMRASQASRAFLASILCRFCHNRSSCLFKYIAGSDLLFCFKDHAFSHHLLSIARVFCFQDIPYAASQNRK